MLDRKLELFLSVADAGSMRAAAKELYMAQPSLSQQIALLEQEVGASLFVRSSKGVKLTQAGKSLYADAKELQLKSSEALKHIEDIAMQSKGTLRIGAGKNQRELLAADVCFEFSKRFPEIEQTFITMRALDLPQALAKGTIDVSEFWSSPLLRDSNCMWTPILTKETCCAVPLHHRLASRDFISPNDLSGERIALNSRGLFDCVDYIRTAIQSSCDDVEFIDASEDEPIEHYALNNSIAITPGPYPYDSTYLKLIHLDLPEKITVGLAYTKHASKITLDFVALAKELYSVDASVGSE